MTDKEPLDIIGATKHIFKTWVNCANCQNLTSDVKIANVGGVKVNLCHPAISIELTAHHSAYYVRNIFLLAVLGLLMQATKYAIHAKGN